MVKIGLNNLPILSWLTISWLAIPILSWLTEYQINTSLSKTFYLTIHAQVNPSKPGGSFNSFLKTGVCSFASKCFTVFLEGAEKVRISSEREKKFQVHSKKKCFPSQSWSFKNRQKIFFFAKSQFLLTFRFRAPVSQPPPLSRTRRPSWLIYFFRRGRILGKHLFIEKPTARQKAIYFDPEFAPQGSVITSSDAKTGDAARGSVTKDRKCKRVWYKV